MAEQKAQIYLADSSGRHELEWFRSVHTFNFGNFYDEHRKPFHNLYLLNDDTLAGGRNLKMQTEADTRVLLLPVVGAINCNDIMVNSGEVLVASAPKGSEISISNPYSKQEDLVNFVQLWFKDAGAITKISSVRSFGFEGRMGEMINIANGANFPSLHIGKYKGRTKGRYSTKKTGSNLFVFVIQGAFEVEDRLLHARDGLALSGYELAEFEALSNDAILLMIEIAAE